MAWSLHAGDSAAWISSAYEIHVVRVYDEVCAWMVSGLCG